MLTKCMYSDPNCKELGIQYAQTRVNAVLNNAGWFSHDGDKLGVGDLSMQDLLEISRNLPIGEVFFVLSEGTLLSLPSNLDRLSPGIEYVVANASWTVTSADIFKLDSLINVQDIEIRDGISYVKYARTAAVTNWVVGLAVPSKIDYIRKNSHWGLDIYYMQDKSVWAVGNYSECYDAASKSAYESLWDTDPDILARYVILTEYDRECITEMANVCGHKCNNLVSKLLGNQVNKCVDFLIMQNGFAFYLDLIDKLEHLSETIPGLPAGKLAYRVD